MNDLEIKIIGTEISYLGVFPQEQPCLNAVVRDFLHYILHAIYLGICGLQTHLHALNYFKDFNN
jgi:hypothetical protein